MQSTTAPEATRTSTHRSIADAAIDDDASPSIDGSSDATDEDAALASSDATDESPANDALDAPGELAGDSGSADSCRIGGPTCCSICSGTCVDLQNDPSHCGSCG